MVITLALAAEPCAAPTALPPGATLAAVLPALAPGCAAVEVELDGDGQPDLAALLTDAGWPGMFRLAVRLSSAATDPVGGWRSVTTWRLLDDVPEAWTALYAKAPGVAVERDALPPAAARRLGKAGAVEACAPAKVDASGRPTSTEASQLCYCSTWTWWAKGVQQQVTACD